jgi:RNA polymerase sigma factor (sigma-70 family)
MEAQSLAASRGGLTIPRSRKLLGAFGDERLVEQLRRGNEAAFEVLYDRHHAAVLSYCRHMLGSRDEAEDALQQAFISAHADIVSSDKPIRFKAWIYTIARNRCLTMLRARRERPSDELDPVSTAGLGEEVQQRADLKELLADMQELPEEQRAALILSELGDLSHEEIAGVIGCEAVKVKSLVFQARSGLIERREARETPCNEIREQLATLRGGSLRRGPLRRHLNACPGCTEFREDVRRQRQMMAVVLPVIPTLGLKESALAAIGVGAGSAGGGALIGGGTGAIVAAKAGVAKVAIIAVAASGAAGGAVVVQKAADDPAPSRGASQQSGGSPGAGAAGVGALDGTDQAAAASDRADTKKRRAGAGDDASRRARKDAGRRGRADGRARGEKGGGRKRAGERKRGFEPVPGGSNGLRARAFARGRGKGHHRGIDKQTARGGANRSPKARSPKPRPNRPPPSSNARPPQKDHPTSPDQARRPPAAPFTPVPRGPKNHPPRAKPLPPIKPPTMGRATPMSGGPTPKPDRAVPAA